MAKPYDDIMIKIPPEKIARLAANTHTLLMKIIEGFGTHSYEISQPKTVEVANFLIKDLIRLCLYQGDDISATKYAAYWSFWIRKLKPIRVAHQIVEDAEKEITDINERAALAVALHFLSRSNRTRTDAIRKTCSASCDGTVCWSQYLGRYMTFNNNYFSEYIVYSLGKRTFGPHHLCALFDSLAFASCSGIGLPAPTKAT